MNMSGSLSEKLRTFTIYYFVHTVIVVYGDGEFRDQAFSSDTNSIHSLGTKDFFKIKIESSAKWNEIWMASNVEWGLTWSGSGKSPPDHGVVDLRISFLGQGIWRTHVHVEDVKDPMADENHKE